MTYVCPMHPEVEQKKAGRCPKCGMALVTKSELRKSKKELSTHTSDATAISLDSIDNFKKGYRILFIIIGLIFITSIAITLRSPNFSLATFLQTFMIGFFLVFASFKLLDLKGFADGYSTYDLLAKQWYGYGAIYPFIELFFGLGMILLPEVDTLLRAEVVIMTFSGLGVISKLQKREKFQCVCLGTFMKVPLTHVTLIEDFGMAILGIILLAM